MSLPLIVGIAVFGVVLLGIPAVGCSDPPLDSSVDVERPHWNRHLDWDAHAAHPALKDRCPTYRRNQGGD